MKKEKKSKRIEIATNIPILSFGYKMPTDKIYVFVSGPYTKGDVGNNVAEATNCADFLLRNGFIPFVPHLAHFWHMMHYHDYEDWMKWDIAWLYKCNALLRIPGDSEGADREVNYAIELGIPVYYDVNELLSDYENSMSA